MNHPAEAKSGFGRRALHLVAMLSTACLISQHEGPEQEERLPCESPPTPTSLNTNSGQPRLSSNPAGPSFAPLKQWSSEALYARIFDRQSPLGARCFALEEVSQRDPGAYFDRLSLLLRDARLDPQPATIQLCQRGLEVINDGLLLFSGQEFLLSVVERADNPAAIRRAALVVLTEGGYRWEGKQLEVLRRLTKDEREPMHLRSLAAQKLVSGDDPEQMDFVCQSALASVRHRRTLVSNPSPESEDSIQLLHSLSSAGDTDGVLARLAPLLDRQIWEAKPRILEVALEVIEVRLRCDHRLNVVGLRQVLLSDLHSRCLLLSGKPIPSALREAAERVDDFLSRVPVRAWEADSSGATLSTSWEGARFAHSDWLVESGVRQSPSVESKHSILVAAARELKALLYVPDIQAIQGEAPRERAERLAGLLSLRDLGGYVSTPLLGELAARPALVSVHSAQGLVLERVVPKLIDLQRKAKNAELIDLYHQWAISADTIPAIRSAALRAICSLQHPNAREVCLRVYNDPKLKSAAVLGLFTLGDAQCAPALYQLALSGSDNETLQDFGVEFMDDPIAAKALIRNLRVSSAASTLNSFGGLSNADYDAWANSLELCQSRAFATFWRYDPTDLHQLLQVTEETILQAPRRVLVVSTPRDRNRAFTSLRYMLAKLHGEGYTVMALDFLSERVASAEFRRLRDVGLRFDAVVCAEHGSRFAMCASDPAPGSSLESIDDCYYDVSDTELIDNLTMLVRDGGHLILASCSTTQEPMSRDNFGARLYAANPRIIVSGPVAPAPVPELMFSPTGDLLGPIYTVQSVRYSPTPK